MPAIYRLEFPGAQANSWGWHLASDLVEAVNNVRSLAELELNELTPLEMGREYSFTDPMSYSNYFLIAVPGLKGELELDPWAPHRGRWLHDAIERRAYFPAKIGVLLLDAVKNPYKAKMIALKRKFVAV